MAIQKGLIGEQDFSRWLGTSAKTFTRNTATGGSVTLNKVGVEVDALIGYGSGTDYTYDTLNQAVGAIGSNQVTLVLRPGTWTIDNNLTIPSTMRLRCPKGVSISVNSGITLTISGLVEAGDYQIFTGSGTVTMNSGKDTKPEWWGSTQVRTVNTSSTLYSYDKIILASNSITISFSSAATLGSGARYTIVNVGTGTATLNPYGSETVNGSASLALSAQYDCADIVSDGTNWVRAQQVSAEVTKKGLYYGLQVSYKDADEVYVGGGTIEIDGTIYNLGANTAKQMTGLSASTWYYLYIDPPASGTTLAAADIEYTTVAPAYDHAKGGWYHPTNTDWRALTKSGGAVFSNAGATIEEFYCNGGMYLFMDMQEYFLTTSSPATTLTAVVVDCPNFGKTHVLVRIEAYKAGVGDAYISFWHGGHDTSTDYQVLLARQDVAEKNQYAQGWLITDASQQVIYLATSGASVDCIILGFMMPEA